VFRTPSFKRRIASGGTPSRSRTSRLYVSPRTTPLKKTLDSLLSLLGIFVSAPLWILFPIAIKIEDRGPIFYRQRRIGKDSRVFDVLKFRTLLQNADQTVRPWMSPDGQWVTRVGGFLRSTALDELPQLLNILKGEMSFVGPRAMPLNEFEDFKAKIPALEQRLMVRPGLTGLAQVYGNATRDARKKLRYDLLYIKNQSFWLDLKLIALSFWITFRGKWESRAKKF